MTYSKDKYQDLEHETRKKLGDMFFEIMNTGESMGKKNLAHYEDIKNETNRMEMLIESQNKKIQKVRDYSNSLIGSGSNVIFSGQGIPISGCG
jgi:hypothetical protein